MLRPTSLSAFDTPAPAAAWTEPEYAGKLVFVRCTLDQALPPNLQNMFMDKSGAQWKVKDIEAGHSPFVSKPKELAQMLIET